MLRKCKKIYVCIFSVCLILLTITVNAKANPVYYKQNVKDTSTKAGSEGGNWYALSIPSTVASSITSSGCAITSIAMVSYPRTAYIKDVRLGSVYQYVTADPYSVYVANGNSVSANWDSIRRKFGFTSSAKILKFSSSLTSKSRANIIADYIDEGYNPIAQTYKSGKYHYIVCISYNIPVNNRSTSEIATVEDASISESTDSLEVSEVTDSDISSSTSDTSNLETIWNQQIQNATSMYRSDPELMDSGITLEQYLAKTIPFNYDKSIFVHDPYNHEPEGVGGSNIPLYKSLRAPLLTSVPKLYLFTE